MTKPTLIRPYEVKDHFSISTATLYRMARAGRIKISKDGRKSFVDFDELQKCLEGKE